MAELVGVYYRVRDEQRAWLNERPEGASEALRAILDDAMANGTKTAALLDEKRWVVAGDSLTFSEFVSIHILSRRGPNRASYIRSPAVSEYLTNYGRTRAELDAEVKRLEAPPSPPSPTDGGEVAQHDRNEHSDSEA